MLDLAVSETSGEDLSRKRAFLLRSVQDDAGSRVISTKEGVPALADTNRVLVPTTEDATACLLC